MNALQEYTLRLADNALILGQRLSEWCGHGPILEQDIALTNIALDQIGQARNLYQYAAKQIGGEANEDSLAFLRDAHEFRNLLLVEQPNGHWGDTLVRQFFFDTFNFFQYEFLRNSQDQQLAAIAGKAIKEITYHAQYSAEWIIRMGDGTDESHEKVQKSLNDLWMWAGEMFEMDPVHQEMMEKGIGPDYQVILDQWNAKVNEILDIATLKRPEGDWFQTGGKKGIHTENLGFILAEMQFLPRAYPESKW